RAGDIGDGIEVDPSGAIDGDAQGSRASAAAQLDVVELEAQTGDDGRDGVTNGVDRCVRCLQTRSSPSSRKKKRGPRPTCPAPRTSPSGRRIELPNRTVETEPDDCSAP